MATKEAVFTKDPDNKKLTVVRAFDAPLTQVWEAWTTGEILDQWWAPKPYKAETKTMDFRKDGRWLYCMAGPQGDRHWCRVDYHTVEPHRLITSAAKFCDEAGNENKDFPTMYWRKEFSGTGDRTTVRIEITFDKTADMETIIKMGFQEGLTMGLGNLDQYLAAHTR
ncbi:MAG: SRPBCC domain-containing protein [Puia sp.]|nr:SRPBCC domain-containing protein [Puia sp.]